MKSYPILSRESRSWEMIAGRPQKQQPGNAKVIRLEEAGSPSLHVAFAKKKRRIRKRKLRKARRAAVLAAAILLLVAMCKIMAAEKPVEPVQQEAVAGELPKNDAEPVETVRQEPIQEKQSESCYSYNDYLLARIAMAEAEGESIEGKAMVILVVLNREKSSDFPDTIEEVIFEDGQFTPVENGRFERVEPNAECWAALDMVLIDGWDESEGALYFEAVYNGENTWHSENLEYIKTVGNHNFYR